MLFSSLEFIFIFLPVTVGINLLLRGRARNYWLLACSLLFYAWGEPSFVFVMIGSILLNYMAGRLLGAFDESEKKRKTVLVLCVIANLLLLGFFKYASLFVSTVKLLPVFSFLPDPQIALPIGISFYTFQIITYIVVFSSVKKQF